MTCPDCEHIIDDDSIYCKYCGKCFVEDPNHKEITINVNMDGDKIVYSEDFSILYSFDDFKRVDYEVNPLCRHIGTDCFSPADYIKILDPYYIESSGLETPDFHVSNDLESLILPDSLLSIGARALYGCMKLTSLVLPKNLGYIDAYALACCINLREIHIKSRHLIFGEGPLLWCRQLRKIYIPQGTLARYSLELPEHRHLLIED